MGVFNGNDDDLLGFEVFLGGFHKNLMGDFDNSSNTKMEFVEVQRELSLVKWES